MKSESKGLARLASLPVHQLALLAAIVAVFLVTGWLDNNHTYFNDFHSNFVIVLRNTVILGIIALGAAVVIISGGIDLSVGSMMAFSATTCALVMVLFAEPDDRLLQTVTTSGVLCGIGAGLLAGLFVGTLHAWLITSIRLPPFVATLASLVGLRSCARAMCEFVTTQHWGNQSKEVNVNTPAFLYIKQHLWVSTSVFVVLAALTWLVLTRTVLGRHIYALGGNEDAARLSGIRTDNIKWFAYCFGGVTGSIAGIFAMADGSVADPVNLARGYELNAIAAAVVGGCSLQGGIGTVTGTVFGALFLRLVIDAVAKLIKAGADVYEGMIVGIVVVMAVTLTQFGQLFRSGREFFPGARGIAAMPTLAIAAGLVAMMGTANIELLRGRSILVGALTTIVTLAALGAFKFLEVRRRRRH